MRERELHARWEAERAAHAAALATAHQATADLMHAVKGVIMSLPADARGAARVVAEPAAPTGDAAAAPCHFPLR